MDLRAACSACEGAPQTKHLQSLRSREVRRFANLAEHLVHARSRHGLNQRINSASDVCSDGLVPHVQQRYCGKHIGV
jgi:hypothetical protein